jgi:anti-anti-sigma regulatory factor
MGALRHLASVPPDVTVVAMPAELDLDSAMDANEAMTAAMRAGAAMVVVDFTRTVLCATVSVRSLMAVHRLAGAFGIELRAVVPAGLMWVFTMMGLDVWLPIYPTLPAALASP